MHRAQANMTVELFDGRDESRLREALTVRFAVFVEEQKVPLEIEIDEHDRDDPETVHALVRDEAGKVVAAGRFYRLDAATAQIGRMAVARVQRGRGVGAVLLAGLVDEARRRGYARAALHAQDHAVGFYLKAGFEPHGETLLDAGIVHQPMERRLTET